MSNLYKKEQEQLDKLMDSLSADLPCAEQNRILLEMTKIYMAQNERLFNQNLNLLQQNIFLKGLNVNPN